MVKHIFICDRCKKRIGENEKPGHIAVKRNIAVYDNLFAKADFCGECIDEIVEFIRHGKDTVCHDGNEGTQRAGRPKEKKQPSEEPQKQSCKKTDYGKILALSKAGWNNAKIADEMGITPQQVSAAKYTAKKKLEDGTLVLGSGDGNDIVGGS